MLIIAHILSVADKTIKALNSRSDAWLIVWKSVSSQAFRLHFLPPFVSLNYSMMIDPDASTIDDNV